MTQLHMARGRATSSSIVLGLVKSNTIAWTAHQIINLHDGQDEVVFDTAIIVTDRLVLGPPAARYHQRLFPSQRCGPENRWYIT